MDSRQYENPSAGRFDPPPPVDPTARRPIGRRWWFQLLLVVLPAVPLLVLIIRPQYRGTWFRLLMPVALVGVVVLEAVLKRINATERGKDSPYTPSKWLTR